MLGRDHDSRPLFVDFWLFSGCKTTPRELELPNNASVLLSQLINAEQLRENKCSTGIHWGHSGLCDNANVSVYGEARRQMQNDKRRPCTYIHKPDVL